MSRSPFPLALEVLRSEGPRAVIDRMCDRWQESVRRKGLTRLDVHTRGLGIDAAPPPVINLSPIPPAPKRGGSHIQMLDRLNVERRLRTVAVAYPRNGRWWLEVWARRKAGIAELGNGLEPADAAVATAHLLGVDIVHVESLHGLPLELVAEIESRGLTSALSIHDFVLFCRRPHLIDAVTGDFCQYSLNKERCDNCLGGSGNHGHHDQESYRRRGGEALRSAGAVIFPSPFLQRRYRELFPERRANQLEAVIAPSSERRPARNRSVANSPRIAFVGGVNHHKGGALIPRIMAEICTRVPTAKGIVYGNGDASLLEPLHRDRQLHIRGYYRQGRLPQLLERDRIAVAILPSIWPEAYGIVIDECLAAGIPVVAFDLGAPGERLGSMDVGALAPSGSGAAGLARGALSVLGDSHVILEEIISTLPLPEDAALSHIELYGELAADRS